MSETQRAFAAGVSVSIAGTLLQMKVDAVPIRRPGVSKSGFNRFCPFCVSGVSQRMVCADHPQDHVFEPEEIRMGYKPEEGTPVFVSDEEYKGATGVTLPDKEITFKVHPAEQVRPLVRFDESAYRLRMGDKPSKAEQQLYAVLRQVVREDKFAFVAELNLKKSQKPYMLDLFGDQLVLQSLVRPDDLAGTDIEFTTNFDDAVIAAAAKKVSDDLLSELVEAFDPAEHANLRRQAREDLIAAKLADPDATVAPTKAPKAAEPETDIMAMLEASLAAVKPAKPVRKATRKTTKKVAA